MTDKASNWEIQDIPTEFKFSIVAEPNPVNGEIKLITNMMGRIQEEYLQTWNDVVRNALIDLGWTPPKESKDEMER